MELVIHGDAATAGSTWNTHGDIAMWSNPKVVEKTRRELASIPLDGAVNVYFDERASGMIVCSNPKSFGEVAQYGVNLHIRNNVGASSRHNPLTPWILMHRLHHSFLMSTHEDIVPERHRSQTVIADCENELLAAMGIDKKVNWMGNAYLITRAFTMRSARIKQLFPFTGDLIAELFAQYVITGDIKLKPAQEWEFDTYEGGARPGEQCFSGPLHYWQEMRGRFLHFFTGLGYDMEMTQERIDKCNAVLAKYKPILVENLQMDLDLMKSVPNVI